MAHAQPGGIHPPGLPAQKVRPICGAEGENPPVIDPNTGRIVGLGLFQMIWKNDWQGNPGVVLLPTKAGRLRLCDDLNMGNAVRDEILADTEYHSHHGLIARYNGPPGTDGEKYAPIVMTASIGLIQSLRGQRAIHQINARRILFQDMPNENNLPGRDQPRQRFRWSPVTSSSTCRSSLFVSVIRRLQR